MTTTVKLITHSWPVEVTTTDHGAEGDQVHGVSRVEPHSEVELHIHATRSIAFKELPEEKAAAGDAA